MNSLLKNFLENWKEVNQTTLNLILAVPEKFYHQKPFAPRFKSFAWEFSCILSTRLGYLRGFNVGQLDESCFLETDEELEKLSKEMMITKLRSTNLKIEQIIKDEKKIKINYFGKEVSKYNVISWLLQHEQLHYGKLILYFSKKKIKIPTSLKKMWGENSFKQDKKLSR